MTEWWEEFFEGPWLHVHSKVITAQQTSEQVQEVEALLGLEAGMAVLDVPCGDGRVALELAGRGYDVTGVDVTPPLLARARRRARDRGLRARWLLADMRNLPWDGEFDAALNVWGSFGYFEDEEEHDAFARAVARALKPGGRFLVETHVAETLLPRFEERSWSRLGGALVLEERRWDHERGRVETDWTFVRGGEPPRTSHSSIRIFTFRELWRLLREVGFSSVQAAETVTGGPFHLGARRLSLVARKG